MKYAWIDEHRRIYGLTESCAVLEVSLSGYQAVQLLFCKFVQGDLIRER